MKNWVDSSQDRDYWRALINATLNLWVSSAMEFVDDYNNNSRNILSFCPHPNLFSLYCNDGEVIAAQCTANFSRSIVLPRI